MFARIPLSVALAGYRARGTESGGDARTLLAQLSGSGAHGVRLDASMRDLRPRELDRSARRDLASLLGRLGLRFAGVDIFVPPEHYVDVAHADRAMAATMGAIDLCAELASLCGTGSARTVSISLKPQHREVVAGVRQYAERAGVRVGLTEGMESAELKGAEKITDETVGVCLDPASLLMRSRDVGQVVLQAGSELVCARLSDTDGVVRTRVGEGRLDVAGFAVSLVGVGYREDVVLDLRGVQDQSGVIEATIAVWEETGLGAR